MKIFELGEYLTRAGASRMARVRKAELDCQIDGNLLARPPPAPAHRARHPWPLLTSVPLRASPPWKRLLRIANRLRSRMPLKPTPMTVCPFTIGCPLHGCRVKAAFGFFVSSNGDDRGSFFVL